MSSSAKMHQQGVALISMLLIFALAVILISSSVTRAHHDVRRTSLHLLNAQAYQYALGGEALARQLLHQDWSQDQTQNHADSEHDLWHQDTQFKPDHGLMRVHIRDLQARFNLNNLVNSQGEVNPLQLQQFQRLLRSLGLPADYAPAILDWLDADTVPRTPSSEDIYFQSLEQDYRSADAAMADVTELQALGIFDNDDLTRLLPYLAALPQPTPINPNTASEVVLSSLHPRLNTVQVTRARQQLPQGFTSTQEFLAHPVTAGLNLSQVHLDVHSQYFLVSVAAQFQHHTTYLQSVLHRDPQSGTITTLSRNLQRPREVFQPRTITEASSP